MVGLPFFKSIAQGWLGYYQSSRGPKFTEEQIRLADHAAGTLQQCYPIEDHLDPLTHSDICAKISRGQFASASKTLEAGAPELDLSKAACLEALKIGVWLLGMCAPESIQSATFNLLACDYYFPRL